MTTTPKPVRWDLIAYDREAGFGLIGLNGKSYALQTIREGGRVVRVRMLGPSRTVYTIARDAGRWHCDCPSSCYRPDEPCKHARAVAGIASGKTSEGVFPTKRRKNKQSKRTLRESDSRHASRAGALRQKV